MNELQTYIELVRRWRRLQTDLLAVQDELTAFGILMRHKHWRWDWPGKESTAIRKLLAMGVKPGLLETK